MVEEKKTIFRSVLDENAIDGVWLGIFFCTYHIYNYANISDVRVCH